MAEVAGLVLGAVGVVGVIGAFKDTIDLFNLVGDSRHLTRDHEILATKLDIEKTLLLQWAEQVGLLSSNYDPRLDDPDTQRVVIRILKCIEVLLEDESKLTQRYGLCVAPEENGLLLKGQKISSRRWDTFVADYKRHEKNEVKKKKDKQSSSKKTRWAIRDKEKFESLVQELAHFITKIMEVVPVERANDYIRQDVEALEDLRQLKILLEASANFPKAIRESTKLTIVERCKDRILAKLWFRRIDDRRESIAIAHKQTLQWALKPPKKDVPWDDLSSWFRSGSGIYWVSGKAGSGKSTLMKYLYLGDHIRKLLSEWAKGEPYHLCNFFFMNLGTMEQKSQEGLSRTLLHQILSANRDLIPEALPHMWKEMHNAAEKNTEDDIHFPSPAETKHAFEVIANSTSDVGRFCFLIDGLDEFAGSYMDGIDFLRSLAGNPRMKIMVSSRPIPDCVAAFEDVPKLNLQDLNRSDIKSYVEDIIGSHKYMKRLIQRHAEEGKEIIRDVIDKSSGVFLWVVLACRKLLSGFADHDLISALRRRVDELPPELEDMFQLMLRKIDKRHQMQASRLLRLCYTFQLMLRKIDKRHQMQASRLLRLCYTFHNSPWPDASEDLYALGVALVDDYPDTTRAAHALEDEEKHDLCSELEGRLRSRCGGLLELTSCGKFCLCTSPHLRHDAYIHSKVVFMHRTVFEFLSNEDVWEFECLRERADEGFNVATALSLYGLHMSRQLLSSSRGTLSDAISIFWEGLRWAVSSDAQPHGEPGLFFNNLHLILQRVNLSTLDDTPVKKSIRQMSDELITVVHRGDWSHVPLAVATELGLANFVRGHPGLPAKAKHDRRHCSCLPILYHAVNRVLLDEGVPTGNVSLPGGESLPRPAMLGILLKAGCDPNELVWRNKTETPWTAWLQKIRGHVSDLDSGGKMEILGTIEDFLAAGADPQSLSFRLADWMVAEFPQDDGRLVKEKAGAILERIARPKGSDGVLVDEDRMRAIRCTISAGSKESLRNRPGTPQHRCMASRKMPVLRTMLSNNTSTNVSEDRHAESPPAHQSHERLPDQWKGSRLFSKMKFWRKKRVVSK